MDKINFFNYTKKNMLMNFLKVFNFYFILYFIELL